MPEFLKNIAKGAQEKFRALTVADRVEREHAVALAESAAGIQKTGLSAALLALNQRDTLQRLAFRLKKCADLEQFLFSADVARPSALVLRLRELLLHRKNLLKELPCRFRRCSLQFLPEQLLHVAVEAQRHVVLPAGCVALHEFQVEPFVEGILREQYLGGTLHPGNVLFLIGQLVALLRGCRVGALPLRAHLFRPSLKLIAVLHEKMLEKGRIAALKIVFQHHTLRE